MILLIFFDEFVDNIKKKKLKLTGSLNEIDLKFYFQRFMITQITLIEMKTDFIGCNGKQE
jgi:hypothetical protein